MRLDGETRWSRFGYLIWALAYLWLPVELTFVTHLSIARLPPAVGFAEVIVGIAGGIGPTFFLGFLGSFAGRGVGRRRAFRSLFAKDQPSATLDQDGLELCIPASGCHRFRWDEIARMAPPDAWLRGSFVEGWPTVDLADPNGRSLLRVPRMVYASMEPVGSKWRSGPRTLAEHVVVMRPDRFAFVHDDPGPPFYWFELAEATADRAVAEGTTVELGQLAATATSGQET